MQIHDISVSQLIEYKNNPRYNDGAVDAVAESIKQYQRLCAWKEKNSLWFCVVLL